MKLISALATSFVLGLSHSAQAQTSGSGFFIAPSGLLVTNFHVVKDAVSVEIVDATGTRHDAKVLRVDRANDIALLQTSQRGTAFLSVAPSSAIRRGEKVYALGFPQTSIQGVEPKLTDGVISSLSGLRDEPTTFQITNAIQPGSSGGPLINDEGAVVGVVVSMLNAASVLKTTGSLPQNVNYAVKSNYLLELVGSIGGIQLPRPSASRSNRRLVDVIGDAERALVRVLVTTSAVAKGGVGATAQTPFQPSSPQDVLVVRIGHVAPTSGPQANYGRDNENGARMAISDLNAKGVVVANRSLRFELIAEDDGADPARGQAAAERLCSSPAVAVVGHLNSATTIAASPVYSRCNLAQITPSATNPNITRRGFKNVFRIIAGDNDLPAGLASYAVRQMGARSAIVVSDGTAYGQGVGDTFFYAARQQGLSVLERFERSTPSDFSRIADEIARQRPDVVFYGGMDREASSLLREFRQRSVGARLLGGDGICTREFAKFSSFASDNAVICAEGGASIARFTGGADWKRRYDAAFPGQFQVYSPYTYDAVMMIAEAIQRSASIDRASLVAAIAQTRYQGVTSLISFGNDGQLVNPPITLYTFQGGQKVPVN